MPSEFIERARQKMADKREALEKLRPERLVREQLVVEYIFAECADPKAVIVERLVLREEERDELEREVKELRQALGLLGDDDV